MSKRRIKLFEEFRDQRRALIKIQTMRSYIITIIFIAFGFSRDCQQQKTISLFDGKDLSGWHVDVPEMDTNASAKNPFIIRNGMLVSMGIPGGHLITDSAFQN